MFIHIKPLPLNIFYEVVKQVLIGTLDSAILFLFCEMNYFRIVTATYITLLFRYCYFA